MPRRKQLPAQVTMRQWRRHYGLTQVEAGRVLGVTGLHISLVELEKRRSSQQVDLMIEWLWRFPPVMRERMREVGIAKGPKR